MRHLAALVLLVIAWLLAVVLYVPVRVLYWLDRTARRLRGPDPRLQDAVAWAAIVRHEQDVRAGRAKVQ